MSNFDKDSTHKNPLLNNLTSNLTSDTDDSSNKADFTSKTLSMADIAQQLQREYEDQQTIISVLAQQEELSQQQELASNLDTSKLSVARGNTVALVKDDSFSGNSSTSSSSTQNSSDPPTSTYVTGGAKDLAQGTNLNSQNLVPSLEANLATKGTNSSSGDSQTYLATTKSANEADSYLNSQTIVDHQGLFTNQTSELSSADKSSSSIYQTQEVDLNNKPSVLKTAQSSPFHHSSSTKQSSTTDQSSPSAGNRENSLDGFRDEQQANNVGTNQSAFAKSLTNSSWLGTNAQPTDNSGVKTQTANDQSTNSSQSIDQAYSLVYRQFVTTTSQYQLPSQFDPSVRLRLQNAITGYAAFANSIELGNDDPCEHYDFKVNNTSYEQQNYNEQSCALRLKENIDLDQFNKSLNLVDLVDFTELQKLDLAPLDTNLQQNQYTAQGAANAMVDQQLSINTKLAGDISSASLNNQQLKFAEQSTIPQIEQIQVVHHPSEELSQASNSFISSKDFNSEILVSNLDTVVTLSTNIGSISSAAGNDARTISDARDLPVYALVRFFNEITTLKQSLNSILPAINKGVLITHLCPDGLEDDGSIAVALEFVQNNPGFELVIYPHVVYHANHPAYNQPEQIARASYLDAYTNFAVNKIKKLASQANQSAISDSSSDQPDPWIFKVDADHLYDGQLLAQQLIEIISEPSNHRKVHHFVNLDVHYDPVNNHLSYLRTKTKTSHFLVKAKYLNIGMHIATQDQLVASDSLTSKSGLETMTSLANDSSSFASNGNLATSSNLSQVIDTSSKQVSKSLFARPSTVHQVADSLSFSATSSLDATSGNSVSDQGLINRSKVYESIRTDHFVNDLVLNSSAYNAQASFDMFTRSASVDNLLANQLSIPALARASHAHEVYKFEDLELVEFNLKQKVKAFTNFLSFKLIGKKKQEQLEYANTNYQLDNKSLLPGSSIGKDISQAQAYANHLVRSIEVNSKTYINSLHFKYLKFRAHAHHKRLPKGIAYQDFLASRHYQALLAQHPELAQSRLLTNPQLIFDYCQEFDFTSSAKAAQLRDFYARARAIMLMFDQTFAQQASGQLTLDSASKFDDHLVAGKQAEDTISLSAEAKQPHSQQTSGANRGNSTSRDASSITPETGDSYVL